MLVVGARRRRAHASAQKEVTWRLQLTWLVMLVLAQLDDIATTAFGLTHGTVEGNSLVAVALTQGGVPLFMVLKLLVAGAMVAAVVLVRRSARYYPGRRALFMHQVALRGTQAGAVALMMVSLNNLWVVDVIHIWPLA